MLDRRTAKRLAMTGVVSALALVSSGCYASFGRGYSAGVVITDLPYGYVELYHGGGYYYFHDGYFYRPHRRGYIRVSPPRGAIIPRLPSRARRYRSGRTEYKEYRGVRYERIRDGRNRGYRVRGKAQNRRHRRR